MAIQSVLWNHLWFLMSLTPFLRFPYRLVRSTCNKFFSRSFSSAVKCAGKRTWKNKMVEETVKKWNVYSDNIIIQTATATRS